MHSVAKDRWQILHVMWLTLLVVACLSIKCQGFTFNRSDLAYVTPENLNVLVDSIIVQSEDATCRGGDPILTVTGENVTWYADSLKTKQLAKGNTYWSAPLQVTTTFYLTQTIDGIETAVTPIVIEVVETFLVNVQTTRASCGKSDGTITATGKGGTAKHPLRYSLNDGPLQESPVFNNLSGGTYLLKIAIEGLCWGTTDITVDEQPSPVIADIDSIAPRCGNPDGSIRIAAFSSNGNVIYSLNGTDFKPENIFENLDGGTYTVTVRDDSLCTTSQTVSMKKSVRLLLNNVRLTPPTCGQPNGSVTINNAQGNGKLTYSLTGRPDQSSNMFNNLAAGSYEISAKDEHGCSDSLPFDLIKNEDPCGPQFYLPNAFSPNNDGVNDVWAAFFATSDVQLEALTIYNRWGEVIFQKASGSIQNGETLWDGTYRGAVLNGMFTYQLKLRLETGKSRVYQGNLMIF